jgi:nicotinamidase-related amidase
VTKILVVVDMQNDFVDGSLGSRKAARLVPRVAEKVKKCRDEGYEVYLTMDTHSPDYLSSPEGKVLPIEHGIKGTHGWQIHAAVASAAGKCEVFQKHTFGSSELMLALQKKNPDVVEFIGMYTEICVISNVLGAKAFLPDAEIVCDSRYCLGASRKGHKAALLTMKNCQVTVL